MPVHVFVRVCSCLGRLLGTSSSSGVVAAISLSPCELLVMGGWHRKLLPPACWRLPCVPRCLTITSPGAFLAPAVQGCPRFARARRTRWKWVAKPSPAPAPSACTNETEIAASNHGALLLRPPWRPAFGATARLPGVHLRGILWPDGVVTATYPLPLPYPLWLGGVVTDTYALVKSSFSTVFPAGAPQACVVWSVGNGNGNLKVGARSACISFLATTAGRKRPLSTRFSYPPVGSNTVHFPTFFLPFCSS